MKKTQLQIFTDALDKLNIGYDEHTFPVGDDELLVVITTPQIIVRSCANWGVPSSKAISNLAFVRFKDFQKPMLHNSRTFNPIGRERNRLTVGDLHCGKIPAILEKR